MYAIVDIAGQQVKVEKDQTIVVNRLEGEEGSKLTFEKVLLLEKDGKVSVGAPVVDGAKVTATIQKHFRGETVIVFKKKRRKGYQKANGHRQYLTRLMIEGISAKVARAKKTEETETE